MHSEAQEDPNRNTLPVEPPDVPYFARKGGWKSSDPEGYWLGPAWDLHSGNSTASYSYCAILGVAKEIEDVQHYCASRAPNATPGDVHKVFPKLPDGLLKRAVVAVHVADVPVRTPAAEIARQMAAQWFNEEVCKNEPKLKQWPPAEPTLKRMEETVKPPAIEAVQPASAPENEFVRQGDVWKITLNGDTCIVPNLVGMKYLLELVLRPNQLVDVNALLTQPSSVLDIDWRVRKKIADEDMPGYEEASEDDDEDGSAHLKRPLKRHRSAGTDGKASPGDADGNAFLKARALELAEDIADRRRLGNDFAKQLTDLEAIKACITSQTWHGKFKDPLSFATETEKARKSVSSAVKASIEAIRKVCPAIADHFKKNIELGKEMMYRPHIVPNWKISRGASL